ncbi:MAG: DUF3021 family protein [Ruminococcus sp.]|nr:DUF3021 family protein [Ruminococcus sp.]
MKDAIKLVIIHFFIITVGVLFVISLANTLSGVEYYTADYPWGIMLVGAITALPSLIFYSKKEISTKQMKIRFIIHFFVVGAIVLTLGYLGKWYTTVGYAVLVFLMYVFVYVIVLAYSFFIQYKTALSINKALHEFNSDENIQ